MMVNLAENGTLWWITLLFIFQPKTLVLAWVVFSNVNTYPCKGINLKFNYRLLYLLFILLEMEKKRLNQSILRQWRHINQRRKYQHSTETPIVSISNVLLRKMNYGRPLNTTLIIRDNDNIHLDYNEDHFRSIDVPGGDGYSCDRRTFEGYVL